jgi:hypothetical protein
LETENDSNGTAKGQTLAVPNICWSFNRSKVECVIPQQPRQGSNRP